MLRIVFDTNVIASALRSTRGAGYALLRSIVAREVTMLATPSLFLEYEDVLKRPEQRMASGASLAEIDEALEELVAFAEPVFVRFQWRPQLADAGDELVLEAAINGQADGLATYNRRDFQNVAPRFGIEVVEPSDLLRRVRRK